MLKNYLTLLAIGLIWGSQFIFQENALEAFNPVWIGTLRAIFGAITLFIICQVMRISGDSKQWLLYAVIGLLEATIPFILIPFAQKELSSSVTAILMGTLPFYALLLAPVFIKNARISKGNLLSVIVGFSGLVVLFYPDLMSTSSRVNLISILAVLFAAICFAVALLLLNRVEEEHPLIVARNVLFMASIQLIIISLTTTMTLTQKSPPLSAFTAVLYLGVMCAGVVYYLYMMSIKNAGAVFTSMTNYLVPAIGVLISALVTNDSIQTTSWLALGIILSALLMNQMAAKHDQKM
ncbi:EamA/RhaT family transporter [Vibrio anguillarum]|uniref:DMT family transporter n=4 Tax=Vibrio anguillarum TaxID=55601 RepID=UPI00188A1D71|nr:EamA family transporter [Vibrio anguillarum]MBF4257747.1 EamA/RhaT family transporter [Vibrio anguillarum]MBF4278012.1 EamA/RhaT family transporter [Vibrio anguillarum]MBF4300353.1 EamA/RhaT family transporter [Vibrio anguillarum]MBF4334098.1 EamA/RhaT family transporter [Vibrio anguillarum]MBF4363675.1 EamA/RhaT family transporter [Vibrio anguillarum]